MLPAALPSRLLFFEHRKVINDQTTPARGNLVPEPTSHLDTPTSYLDKKELNRFLILIRDSYQMADLANLFLEHNCQETPVVNVAALANLRDVLSHFATFLRPGQALEKRKEQLINATEHLRRAILEPYELTYRDNANHFRPLFQRYVEELLPEKDQHPFLLSAPTRHNVESRLNALHTEAEKGRLAKANNAWVPDWEAGIAHYMRAFEELKALVHEVEEHWYKFQQVKKSAKDYKHNVLLHYLGIAVTILVFVLGEYKFHFMDRLFGLVASLWHGLHALLHF
jgi:hypothetical protein